MVKKAKERRPPDFTPWWERITCTSTQWCAQQHICRNCSQRLKPRRTAYCSKACEKEFDRNHFWTVARYEALRRATKNNEGYICQRCGQASWFVEVNHITPLRGSYRSTTCLNHQTNLEVLCRPCHWSVTAQQGRDARAAVTIDPA